MLDAAFESFEDTDGNFVEQFQTTGFDARVFELFLHAYFSTLDGVVSRPRQRPDFLITRGALTVAVEATTSNPTQGPGAMAGSASMLLDEEHLLAAQRPGLAESSGERSLEERAEVIARSEHELPIRLGGALRAKLQQRYWEDTNFAGRPLVFAVEAFHATDSLYFSSAGLAGYLYGTEQSWTHDADGTLRITSSPRTTHRVGDKVIPSHFFSLPDTEYVSAVLFTNSGTTAKFTRMGYQAGLHRGNLLITRAGFYPDPDPNSATPRLLDYTLDDPPFLEEWWNGVTVFHNPSARHPLPHEFFTGATQVYPLGDQMAADGSSANPYMSRTFILAFDDETFRPAEQSADGIGSILEVDFEELEPQRALPDGTISREVSWFANASRTVAGTVIRDLTDGDYGCVLLGRDSRGRLRCIEAPTTWFPTQSEANTHVLARIRAITATGDSSFPQGDEDEP